jgi:fructokinase
LGLPTDTLAVDAVAPTGTVSTKLAPGGQPEFTIAKDVAWDRITTDVAGLAAGRAADAVCFGSLAQRAEAGLHAVRTLVAATRNTTLRIFDVNLRPPFIDREVVEGLLALANVLKLNDPELPLVAVMFGLTGGVCEQLGGLARRHGLLLVALTRGPCGSLLLADGHWSDQPGLPVEVVDTVGAGDAFTAAMTMGLLAGLPLDEVNRRAKAVAAYVCSQPGATPALPKADAVMVITGKTDNPWIWEKWLAAVSAARPGCGQGSVRNTDLKHMLDRGVGIRFPGTLIPAAHPSYGVFS